MFEIGDYATAIIGIWYRALRKLQDFISIGFKILQFLSYYFL